MITESFWDFSCRVYREEGVSEICLRLQDMYGLDVNLLLLCCWHASTRGSIDQALFADLLAAANSWANNVVVPLRETRRWMKTQLAQESLPSAIVSKQFIQIREQIKALELRCEQHQQTFLQDLLTSTPTALNAAQQLEAAAHNLLMLFAQRKQPIDDSLRQACSELIGAIIAHPSITRGAAQELTLKALR